MALADDRGPQTAAARCPLQAASCQLEVRSAARCQPPAACWFSPSASCLLVLAHCPPSVRTLAPSYAPFAFAPCALRPCLIYVSHNIRFPWEGGAGSGSAPTPIPGPPGPLPPAHESPRSAETLESQNRKGAWMYVTPILFRGSAFAFAGMNRCRIPLSAIAASGRKGSGVFPSPS
jgi:hypothetical protein